MSQPYKGRSRRIGVRLSALVLLGSLAACASNDSPPVSAAGASSVAPGGVAPSIDGKFEVAADRSLALKCWGTASPTVIFDAGTGDPGIARVDGTSYIDVLAGRNRVCAYDRAGLGSSDPAPARKRLLDDVAADLHALLGSAKIAPPYVLVGSSGGGFDVYDHAGRYPDEVVGLVMLDVPAGQANIPPSEVPAWNSTENPEHMDYVAVERQMALHRLPVRPIPVTVVTASGGQSADPKEQLVWLRGSSNPVQVVLNGGHNIFSENPSGVVAQIQKVLAATRSR
jgi:pimeloyl-ACP methyl ester carboxylesterase